uniref:SEC63 domain-containing protein n=1 Tax=Salix viminalis TaxID=40686 RepID=A0A6N2N9Y5_SALVM
MFLHILSGASEDDELPVRHNEENYNEAFSRRVRYIVDKNALDDPHVKANLLFHTHFSQLESPISDYVTDLKSVLGQSIRIIQAMVDICANSGWLLASVTCMHLLQMVMQGLWFEKDSSLQILYPCLSLQIKRVLREDHETYADLHHSTLIGQDRFQIVTFVLRKNIQLKNLSNLNKQKLVIE